MLDFDNIDYFTNLILTNSCWISEREVFELFFGFEISFDLLGLI